jgi:hypothetical protein
MEVESEGTSLECTSSFDASRSQAKTQEVLSTRVFNMSRHLLVGWLLVVVCSFFVSNTAAAQNARVRARLAAQHQSALQEDGCSGCRVWVSGPDNTTLHIRDPEATTTPNDYNGYPVLWCDSSVGFRRVIYYSSRDRVYARHSC